MLGAFLRLVQTDMGNTGAKRFGMKEAPVPTKDSVAGVVAQVSLFWKETHFRFVSVGQIC